MRGKCYLFISDSFDDMEEIKENVDPKRTTPTSESGGFSSTADNVDPKPTTPTSESGDVSPESLQQAVARLEKGINKLFGVF